jgi:hypothetical protein
MKTVNITDHHDFNTCAMYNSTFSIQTQQRHDVRVGKRPLELPSPSPDCGQLLTDEQQHFLFIACLFPTTPPPLITIPSVKIFVPIT